MKIKKHGKLFNKEAPIHTEKFKCDSCGCEFTCKDDEYYTDIGGADWNYGSGSITTTTTTTTYTIGSTIRDYLVCSCPECHKIVKKVHERQRDNYWYVNPCTTTTLKGDWYKPDKNDNDLWTTITCNVIGTTESSEL